MEACSDVEATLKAIRAEGMKPAITLKPATPVSEVEPYLSMVDMVLVMSVEPGFGGQKLIPETVEKVRQLRKIIDDQYPGVLIEIDGGINLVNVSDIVEAGADVIVAGSAVFGSNTEEMTKKFKSII